VNQINRKAVWLAALAVALPVAPQAQAQGTHHRQHVASADGYRPLTIVPHRGVGPIIYKKDEVIAPGGFSAHGYGFGDPGSEAARRAFRNADVRERTDGVFGYGLDGLGGTQVFGDHGETGYNNPSWGNAFSTNVGYNGVPTALAFGPAYANRYIADHEPEFDNHEDDWPSPPELGYQPAGANDDDD
jgi:hypothetical protein